MGRDESGTLARLRKNRSEHLEPVLAKYGGRLVKLTGDGALVEFASAVDALSAAIEFQQAMAEASANQPADTTLVFRMGLRLGDLMCRRPLPRREKRRIWGWRMRPWRFTFSGSMKSRRTRPLFKICDASRRPCSRHVWQTAMSFSTERP